MDGSELRLTKPKLFCRAEQNRSSAFSLKWKWQRYPKVCFQPSFWENLKHLSLGFFFMRVFSMKTSFNSCKKTPVFLWECFLSKPVSSCVLESHSESAWQGWSLKLAALALGGVAAQLAGMGTCWAGLELCEEWRKGAGASAAFRSKIAIWGILPEIHVFQQRK